VGQPQISNPQIHLSSMGHSLPDGYGAHPEGAGYRGHTRPTSVEAFSASAEEVLSSHFKSLGGLSATTELILRRPFGYHRIDP